VRKEWFGKGDRLRFAPILRRRAVVGSGVALILLLDFVGLGRAPLFEPDGGRYAEIPREMVATGDLVVPRLDGVLYFEKPPLYYWLNALSIRVWGTDEAACRFWSALFGFGGVALAYVLARQMGGSAVAAGAAVVLASSPLYATMARLASIDMTVSFFIGAALVAFWFAHRAAPGRRRTLLWRAAAASAALAVLAKGLIGLLLPGAIVFLYLLATGQWRLLHRIPWLSCSLLFLAIAVPWHVAIARRYPAFVYVYFVQQHFLRYATLSSHRWQPFWFFIPVILVGFLPWSGLFPAAVALLGRGQRQSDRDRSAAWFLSIWAAFVLFFFSLSKSKLIPYILPAAIPLAVLAALAVGRALEVAGAGGRTARRGLAVTVAFLALLAGALAYLALGRASALVSGLSLPRGFPLGALTVAVLALLSLVALLRRRLPAGVRMAVSAAVAFQVLLVLAAPTAGEALSTRELASVLRSVSSDEDEIVSFGIYPQTLPFYLGRLVDVAGSEQGELYYGVKQLPLEQRRERFPDIDELARRWTGARRVFLVTGPRFLARLRENGIDPGPPLASEGALQLFCNRPHAAG